MTTTALDYSSPGLVPRYDVMKNAYLAHAIPVVDFIASPNTSGICVTDPPTDWKDEITNFITNIKSGTCPTSSCFVYFEIGNEVNNQQYSSWYHGQYGSIFGAAAKVIATSHTLANQGFKNFRILTAGMFAPTAVPNLATCNGPGNNGANIYDAYVWIYLDAAKNGVPTSDLGVAVHPYGYDTHNKNEWQNYYYQKKNGYFGDCHNLNNMLNLWNSDFPGLPIIFTEINYKTTPGDTDAYEAHYLADLFTWLDNHGGYDIHPEKQVRVLWFQGTDAGGLTLGIYKAPTSAGDYKQNITLPVCGSQSQIGSNQPHNFNWDYFYLRRAYCYH